MGGRVDEPPEHGAGDPAQRLLARVGRAELERGDAEPVAALLGQVHDEPLLAQHREQVVDARARQPEVARDRRGRHGRGVRAEQLQDGERVRRRRGRWPRGPVSQMRDETGSERDDAGARGVCHGVMDTAFDPTGTPRAAGTRPAVVPVGPGPLSFAAVVDVARGDATVELTADALRAIAESRGAVEALASARARRTTASRPGSARSPPATSRPSAAPRCSAACPQPRGGRRPPRSSARWCARMMLLRLSTLATGRTGVRAADGERLRRAAQRGHHAGRARARLARVARATSRRSRTARSR